MLFNIIDCAAVAACVICTTKHPEWNQRKNYKRRLFLKELGCKLVEMALHRRQENPQVMQRHVKMAFKALGRQIDRPAIAHDAEAAQPQSRRQRCLLCARSNDKRLQHARFATIRAAKITDSSSATLVTMRLMT